MLARQLVHGKKGGQSTKGKQQGEGANLDDEEMCVICLEGEKTHLLTPMLVCWLCGRLQRVVPIVSYPSNDECSIS